MANSAQARKRARQADKRGAQNSAQRAAMRTTIKNVVKAIDAGNKEDAAAAYKVAIPAIDKGVTKGHLHKNAAARQKSRLNTRVKAM